MSPFSWFKRRKDHARLIEADVARFADQAYFEARARAQRGTAIGGNRPKWHWTRVKIEIAKRQEIEIGQSGADKRELHSTIGASDNSALGNHCSCGWRADAGAGRPKCAPVRNFGSVAIW
jgi:hypothetical protein